VLLAHDVTGSGPPVLLLHAGVGDRRMWDPLLPGLAHRFLIIRPDLRGFGDSPLPPEPYADADDVAALLDHLGVADAAVVGSSFGGRIALELATRHPDRVRELVLLCPAYRGVPTSQTATDFGEDEDQLIELGDLDGAVRLNVETWLGPEATDEVRTAVAIMQRQAFEVQLAAEAVDPGPEQQLVEVAPAAIAVPTVVVEGELDMDHFRTVARTLTEEIPGAELVSLPWAGHLPSLERPDAVTTLLLDVLRNDPDVHAP
jgi:pimeloyl-ACP methyl ester carboxylesterase